MTDHIKKNLKAFYDLKEEFVRENDMKYALFHDGELVGVYNDLDDTYRIGKQMYPENDFFIRQINAPAGSFGFFSDKIITVTV